MQTDATLLDNNSSQQLLDVTCCALFHTCCTCFVVVQSLKPVKLLAPCKRAQHCLAKKSQHCWELLRPFARSWKEKRKGWESLFAQLPEAIIVAIRRSPARSSAALAACWIFSRSSRVQILGHACNKPTGYLLPVGVFNHVMLYLNYLFLSIWVECL